MREEREKREKKDMRDTEKGGCRERQIRKRGRNGKTDKMEGESEMRETKEIFERAKSVRVRGKKDWRQMRGKTRGRENIYNKEERYRKEYKDER